MDDETVRRDFEVWASRKHYSLRCLETGEYEFPDTQESWVAWLESASRADKRAREEACRIIARLKVAEECSGPYEHYQNAVLQSAINAIRATIKETPE